VLADVFDQIKAAGINVQETENIVFDGAVAAVARIHLDQALPGQTIEAIRSRSNDIIEVSLLKL
jgi:D-3-phosphoglycerate dehydrogenase